jgi:drug/metabolite transporter (DMT)-like permease
VLFLGLLIAITQGSLNFLTFNTDVLIGVLIVLLITALWMFGHTMTKQLFSRNDFTPTQMVFIRNMLSGVILIITYFTFSPVDLSVFFNPYNQFFFIIMGTVYGLGLFCWYKTLSYLDVSNATIVLSPTPIVTAIFATFILGEFFTPFHLIGAALVIFSIIIIIKQKKD